MDLGLGFVGLQDPQTPLLITANYRKPLTPDPAVTRVAHRAVTTIHETRRNRPRPPSHRGSASTAWTEHSPGRERPLQSGVITPYSLPQGCNAMMGNRGVHPGRSMA